MANFSGFYCQMSTSKVFDVCVSNENITNKECDQAPSPKVNYTVPIEPNFVINGTTAGLSVHASLPQSEVYYAAPNRVGLSVDYWNFYVLRVHARVDYVSSVPELRSCGLYANATTFCDQLYARTVSPTNVSLYVRTGVNVTLWVGDMNIKHS